MVTVIQQRPTDGIRRATGGAAEHLEPLVQAVLGGPSPVRFELWDGSSFGGGESGGTLVVRSPMVAP